MIKFKKYFIKTRKCEHINTRCVHGDEINHLNGRRVVCLDCHRSLDWPLPQDCWHTGGTHLSKS